MTTMTDYPVKTVGMWAGAAAVAALGASLARALSDQSSAVLGGVLLVSGLVAAGVVGVQGFAGVAAGGLVIGGGMLLLGEFATGRVGQVINDMLNSFSNGGS